MSTPLVSSLKKSGQSSPASLSPLETSMTSTSNKKTIKFFEDVNESSQSFTENEDNSGILPSAAKSASSSGLKKISFQSRTHRRGSQDSLSNLPEVSSEGDFSGKNSRDSSLSSSRITSDDDIDYNNNNNNKHFNESTTSSSPLTTPTLREESGVINDTESDFGSDASDMTRASSSGSGSSSSGGAIGKVQKLPFGLTMTQLMVLLILIPITFLVAYTAVPLYQAFAERQFLSSHREIVTTVLDGTMKLQEERRDTSLFFAQANPNSTRAQELKISIASLREKSDFYMHRVLVLMQDSDLQYKREFLAEITSMLIELSAARRAIDLRATTGAHVRSHLLMYVERVYALLLWLAKDARSKELETRIFVFMLLRRVQNSVGLMRAIGSALISRDGHDLQNLMELRAMRVGVERDVVMILHSGKSEALLDVKSWYLSSGLEGAVSAIASVTQEDRHKLNEQLLNNNNGTATISDSQAFFRMADKLQTGKVEIFGKEISLQNWIGTANKFVGSMHQQDLKVLDVILNGNILDRIVIIEVAKLIAAVLACVVAAVLVIKLNKREQFRMEVSLKNTRKLADAVQRFVPKNQLKVMGVRSVTQVHSGLQVEVAQTMLFSDIRNFTGLSESMGNTELFEWLQNYVSRMTRVTQQQRGFVDKFIGDAVFAVFPQPSNGIRAAVEMHVATDQLNLELVAQGKHNLVGIGVGLHYGVVVAGVFGDSSRLQCTMVASDVNLASRLEGLTKSFGAKIIASSTVIDRINQNTISFRRLGRVQVSGSQQAVTIYDVFQCDPLNMKQHKISTKEQFEEAVQVVDDNPIRAQRMFSEVAEHARLQGVRDIASEARSDASSLAGSPVMSFEKDGSTKSSPSSAKSTPATSFRTEFADSNNNNANNYNNNNANNAKNFESSANSSPHPSRPSSIVTSPTKLYRLQEEHKKFQEVKNSLASSYIASASSKSTEKYVENNNDNNNNSNSTSQERVVESSTTALEESTNSPTITKVTRDNSDEDVTFNDVTPFNNDNNTTNTTPATTATNSTTSTTAANNDNNNDSDPAHDDNHLNLSSTTDQTNVFEDSAAVEENVEVNSNDDNNNDNNSGAGNNCNGAGQCGEGGNNNKRNKRKKK